MTARILLQADRLSPAANTHEESPKNSFVSYALDYFPPADPAASWGRQAGSINADLLAASPDHVALQNTLWDAWTLGVAFSLTSAPKYQQQGVSLLSTTFEGDQALLPNMQYSLMIPDTSMEDARMNPLGFYEMNDVGLALDAATLLNISPPTASGFNQWMWCAVATCPNLASSVFLSGYRRPIPTRSHISLVACCVALHVNPISPRQCTPRGVGSDSG